MALFPLFLFCFLLPRRYDVVVASTFPPVVTGLAGGLGARCAGARFIYHCMDIHPEIGRLSGEFLNPLIFATLRWLDTLNCRLSARVVVLSGDMRASLLDRPAPPDGARIDIRNNFALPDYDGTPPASLPREIEGIGLDGRDVFRIVFSGNIGRFQGLEALIDAVTSLPSEVEVELLFVGEGGVRSALEARAARLASGRIHFIGQQSATVANAIVGTADLCVVSLVPRIHCYAFPSKTMTYISLGQPVLVIVEHESELARLVTEEGIGVVTEPGDVDGLRRVLLELTSEVKRLSRMREAALRVYEREYAENRALPYWSRLVTDVACR